MTKTSRSEIELIFDTSIDMETRFDLFVSWIDYQTILIRSGEAEAENAPFLLRAVEQVGDGDEFEKTFPGSSDEMRAKVRDATGRLANVVKKINDHEFEIDLVMGSAESMIPVLRVCVALVKCNAEAPGWIWEQLMSTPEDRTTLVKLVKERTPGVTEEQADTLADLVIELRQLRAC